MSRQLWWGHRIPAWYDDDGNFYVAAHRSRSRKQAGGTRTHAGQRRARHLVLVRAVAVLHPGLARADTGTRALPADLGAGHRLRHHLLLGRAHGDDVQASHRQSAVPRSLRHRPGARLRRPEDEQVEGQRARPDRPDRRHRRRRTGRQAHPGPDESQAGAAASKSAPARNSRKASPPTAPMPCASPSPVWPRTAATSSSTCNAPRATATSATSCGTPPASR